MFTFFTYGHYTEGYLTKGEALFITFFVLPIDLLLVLYYFEI